MTVSTRADLDVADDDPDCDFANEEVTQPDLEGLSSLNDAFVRARVRLQSRCNDLAAALQQGLALDMEIAAVNLETAAQAFVAAGKRLQIRGAHAQVSIQAALYETRLFGEVTADLFEKCLSEASPARTQPRLRDLLSRAAARTGEAIRAASSAASHDEAQQTT